MQKNGFFYTLPGERYKRLQESYRMWFSFIVSTPKVQEVSAFAFLLAQTDEYFSKTTGVAAPTPVEPRSHVDVSRLWSCASPVPALCLQNCLGTTAYDIGNVFALEVSKRFDFGGYFFGRRAPDFIFPLTSSLLLSLSNFGGKLKAVPMDFTIW